MLYTLEFIELLEKYKLSIFLALQKYQKSPSIPIDTPLANKLSFMGDYPNDVGLSDLQNMQHPLSCILSVVEAGEIHLDGQFGAHGSRKRVSLNLNIWTVDPLLREYTGKELYNFLDKNIGLVQSGQWQMVDRPLSYGQAVTPLGYYRRNYAIWLQEFNLY